MKKSLKFLMSVAVATSLTTVSFAQTVEEAAEALKKGSELVAAKNFAGAIAELEKCIDISKKVGTDADEYRQKAETPIPNLYLSQADKLGEAKDWPGAIKALEATNAAADKYNQPEIKEKTVKPMSTAYMALAGEELNAKKLTEALQNLDKAIQLNPDLAYAYYMKGGIYMQQKNEEKMVENFKLAVEKGTATNDSKAIENAKSVWSKYFYNEGLKALKEKKTDAAIQNIQKAVEADDSYGDAYYRLAMCYNTKKNYDLAVSNAEKALTLKTTSKEAVYYALGEAYMGKKDNAKACDAFKNVTDGPYAPRAKYYRETTLKCK